MKQQLGKCEKKQVMKMTNLNRTRKISLRLTSTEYLRIERKWNATTCRKLSEYVRHCLFDKPITTYYRNQSMDDFITEASQLRSELNHIGNNLNQTTKRLYTLNQISEFKSWLIAFETDKKILFEKVDEIKLQIQKIAEAWLQ